MNPTTPTPPPTSSIEIERRFLPTSLPEDLAQYPHRAIRQGYLAVEKDRNVRIRNIGDAFILTSKKGKSMARAEVEVGLTSEQFHALWPLTDDRRIEKTRYFYPWEGHTFEIDLFEGRYAGLIIAEVEFTTMAEAEAFVPPAFLGREVTGVKEYGNASLALKKN